MTEKAPEPGTDAGSRAGVLDDALAARPARVPVVAAVRPPADGSATPNAADGGPLRAGRAWSNLAGAYVPDGAVLADTLTRGCEKVPVVFAGVSLLIGPFLVVNAFTLPVKRCARGTAPLRAVDASRRRASRSVLLEVPVAGFLLGLGIAAHGS
ncbi:hypothetical protein AB0E83_13475 [Streptomyces sp. NPDC035033]|uniref:hypothetical protein n=1 Tax=Streptomyces sp. NPDC035033 TaxID=3155368 RepID=UPI0033E5BAA5